MPALEPENGIDRGCPYCYKDRCVHKDAIIRSPPSCYDVADCPLMRAMMEEE
jgi:hypothetical protein